VPAPAEIAAAADGADGAASADVTVSTVTDTSALDSKPDARQNPPKPAAGNEATTSTAQPGDPQAGQQKPGKKKKKAKNQSQQ
jgi:hypothetical protein